MILGGIIYKICWLIDSITNITYELDILCFSYYGKPYKLSKTKIEESLTDYIKRNNKMPKHL